MAVPLACGTESKLACGVDGKEVQLSCPGNICTLLLELSIRFPLEETQKFGDYTKLLQGNKGM